MTSCGIAEEFADIDFDDRRLSKRAVQTATTLAKSAKASIPTAADDRAETEAIYRFIDNAKVSSLKLTSQHRRSTLQRIGQCEVVLLVQDTTELDLTRPSQQVNGAGPLTHNSRRGGFYHPLLAFNADGLALGTVWNKFWVRESIETDRTAAEKRVQARKKPIEQKESFRWVEGVRAALDVAKECPHTQFVTISDSESDIYEVLAEPRGNGEDAKLELIVRAAGDRNIKDCDGTLLSKVRSAACLYRATIDVSARRQKTSVKTKSPRKCSREARLAQVEVRATRVTIRCPRNGPRRPSLEYNVVLVEEVAPPAGEAPIQWLLITSLPIDTIEQVERIAALYCHRWQIEIYFRVLKSGCRIQERYFETVGRLENCLAFYIVIAWRILYLCRLGRECPDLPCDIVFADSEWKAVYTIINRKPPPSQPPSINEMIRMIASLGGYVMRTTTQPGTETLWLGLQRVSDLANAWDTFGPGAKTA